MNCSFSAAPRDGAAVQLLRADAENITQRSAMHYDRAGDDHFDVVSALMKSLRGSDPDAALHYLARLLEAGDLIGACRRILCSASEDIGLAYPQAATIVKSCVDSALQLGLPEARLPLAEAVLLLATAPKSNSVVMSIDAAIADVRAGKAGPIPRELQNVHADGTGFEREQATNIRTATRGTGCSSSICPMSSRENTITSTATTRPSRPRAPTGSASRESERWTFESVTF